MYVEYNPNPVRSDGVGDCSVRAVAKALNITWEEAYAKLALNGFLMGDVISSDSTWGSVLRQNGFRRYVIPNECEDCYTVEDFCVDHPNGVYVVKSDNHVATVVDGLLYDSWPSQHKVVIYYWTNNKEDEH